MRKEDRVRQQQSPSEQPAESDKPEPKEQEKVKGSGGKDQPSHPQRQPGRLPIPD